MQFRFSKEKINTDPEKINELLTRGVEDVFVADNLRKKLESGKKLRIKLGFDPTGDKIHIGRGIVLRKLKAFQDLGHTVVFIVGDFTAQIGDPSDKLEKRPMLGSDKIKENLKKYKEQVGRIIDLTKAEFHYNSVWLKKLGFQEISELAESFSVQQMSSRRNFKERFEKGEEVSLREFLYPLLQGYDSVMVNADVEIGGFDQLFNLKAGRVIQRYYKKPEQDILTTQMLEGTDGRKMSTSWGNVINIIDDPRDMYGKIMSLKDELILKYFTLCTDLPSEEIVKIKTHLGSGENPRDIKMKLAREIVAMHHGQPRAVQAEENFINIFKKGGVPEDVPSVSVSSGTLLADVLLQHKLISSKTEWRRLVTEHAISTQAGEEISDPFYTIEKNATIKVGKRRFISINLTK